MQTTMKTGQFNEKKATQVAGQLLKLAGGRLNYMALIKLMYIVDRESLKRWGQPVTNDEYYSLPHGPILSRVYDLISDEPSLSESSVWQEYIKKSGYNVELIQGTTSGTLSDSETELIKDVFSHYGHLDRFQLRDLTHQFEEWKDPEKSRLPITYEDILRAVGRGEEAEKVAGQIKDINFFRALLNS